MQHTRLKPREIGKAYDQITQLWESADFDRSNGIAQHQRAIAFTKQRGKALDVGCGCTGRVIDLLQHAGFSPQGVDVSEKMLQLARKRHPEVTFYLADICEWDIEETYVFISAWDSIWHVPLQQQEFLVTKLVASLDAGGILIMSFGGTNDPSDHTNNDMGPQMYYSTLGTSGFLELLSRLGCICRHLEYDQHPELHTYLIAQKL